MIPALIAVGSIFTVASIIPYVSEIIRGKAKPRVVSWFTWSLLMAIACVASFSDGQYAGGILLLLTIVGTTLVVALGWHYGDRKIERFDVVCQFGATAGLVLWLVFNSPQIAIIATLTIDIIGSLPTLKHCWQKPHEETWLSFALATLGGLCTILAAGDWQITSVVYPIYITLINGLFAVVILVRHKHRTAKSLMEFRDL